MIQIKCRSCTFQFLHTSNELLYIELTITVLVQNTPQCCRITNFDVQPLQARLNFVVMNYVLPFWHINKPTLIFVKVFQELLQTLSMFLLHCKLLLNDIGTVCLCVLDSSIHKYPSHDVHDRENYEEYIKNE